MADNLYFDNLHKQLYCNHQKRVVALLPGHSDSMAIGLSDFAELPGQSTWYIRSVVFKVTGYTDVGGPSPDNEISFLGGSCNRDISATDKPELADFQDIAGWPWKGINSMIQVQSTLQANRFSWTKTYRPSKNLTLSREQDIVLCMSNNLGNNVNALMFLYIHAERGD